MYDWRFDLGYYKEGDTNWINHNLERTMALVSISVFLIPNLLVDL